VQWRAAGGQDLQGGTVREERGRQVGDGCKEMLAVVEQQQRLPGIERPEKIVEERAIRRRHHTDRRNNGGRDQGGIGEG
jgi:hypothetical protein